jgi:hypothetical protein
METKEQLIKHFQSLIKRIESSKSDEEALECLKGVESYNLILIDTLQNLYYREEKINEKLDKLIDRTSTVSCRFSEKDSSTLAMMTGVGIIARLDAVDYLKKCLLGAKVLTICDPYFLQPYGKAQVQEYLEAITEVIPLKLPRIELFIRSEKRNPKVAEGLNEFCRNREPKIKIKCYETEEIHDRIWMVDYDKAYVVGTSFNGVGNKWSFILDLPKEDTQKFIKELKEVRSNSTNSSNSA